MKINNMIIWMCTAFVCYVAIMSPNVPVVIGAGCMLYVAFNSRD